MKKRADESDAAFLDRVIDEAQDSEIGRLCHDLAEADHSPAAIERIIAARRKELATLKAAAVARAAKELGVPSVALN